MAEQYGRLYLDPEKGEIEYNKDYTKYVRKDSKLTTWTFDDEELVEFVRYDFDKKRLVVSFNDGDGGNAGYFEITRNDLFNLFKIFGLKTETWDCAQSKQATKDSHWLTATKKSGKLLVECFGDGARYYDYTYSTAQCKQICRAINAIIKAIS